VLSIQQRPSMPPLHQRPRCNDAYVIMQLSPTGLTPWGNTSKIGNKKNLDREKNLDWLAGQPIQICYKMTKKRPCTQSEFANKRTLEQKSHLKKHKHTKN
jgi:hypothetical protein